MSTSSTNFSGLADEYPAERDTLRRIEELLSSGGRAEMTLDRLVQRVAPVSVEALTIILESLAQAGVIRRVFRIESPWAQAPIDDYPSYRDIPLDVYDYHVGRDLHVTPEHVRVMYTI